MKAIALTGSIGSGKTTVLKFVRDSHIPTIDCDAIVSKAYREKPVKKKLRKMFGTANRREIAGIVFSSPKKRRKLEKLLHPLVWKRVKSKLSLLRKQGKLLAVVDVPLLFEARWQNRFNSVIFVKVAKKTCIQRLAKKGFSRKEALQRWNAQLPPRKKVKKSDYLIDNSGTVAKTRKQVRQLLSDLAVK
jgi:dephospho-CoA kinase